VHLWFDTQEKLGDLCTTMGRYEVADRSYGALLHPDLRKDLDPKRIVKIHISRGKVFEIQGDYEQALKCFKDARNYLSGFDRTQLVPERIRVSRLLLFGLGALSELTYDKLYNAGYEMARTVIGIGATDLALPVPAAGRGPLNLDGMTEALLTGIFDGFGRAPEKLPTVILEIPGEPDHTRDTRRGVDLFRQHAGGADIEILSPGDRTADITDTLGDKGSDKKISGAMHGQKVQPVGD
jgi:hypothetical protein